MLSRALLKLNLYETHMDLLDLIQFHAWVWKFRVDGDYVWNLCSSLFTYINAMYNMSLYPFFLLWEKKHTIIKLQIHGNKTYYIIIS